MTTVDQLNRFLRNEMSAVETYRLALETLRSGLITSTLQKNLRSHEDRVSILRSEIRNQGGNPTRSPGRPSSFVELVAATPGFIDRGAAVAALENGEDRGRGVYQQAIDHVEPSLRELVQGLLSEQLRTHVELRMLEPRLGDAHQPETEMRSQP
jgi:hypothetical protein